MDSVIEVEFKELCRICANPRGDNVMISIFGRDGIRIELLEKVKRYLPISVCEDDGLPDHICISCVSKLNVCHLLVQTCTEADARLHALKQQLDIETSQLRCPDTEYDAVHQEAGYSSDSNADTKTSLQVDTDSCPIQEGSSSHHSAQVMCGREDSQVAVILAEKDDQKDVLPKLNIVLVNVPKEEAPAGGVTAALKVFRERQAALSRSSKQNFVCSLCEILFMTKQELVSHYEENHPRQVHQCMKCGEIVCGSDDAMLKHGKLHKFDDIMEDMNEMTLLYLMTSRVNKSISVFTEKKGDFNVICLGAFNADISGTKAEKQLKHYILTLKSRIEIKPEIQEILIGLVTKYCKEAEQKCLATKMQDLICRICGKAFKIKNSLRNHLRTAHKPNIITPREKKKKCSIECCHCYKQVEVRYLDAHVENHHGGGKELVCLPCDEAYQQTCQPQPHMRTDSCWPFKCDCEKCLQGFDNEKQCLKHKSKHEKVFACDMCGKSFKRKKNLKRHIVKGHETNPKEMSVICDVCGKSFRSNLGLTVHLKQIHSEDSKSLIKERCQVCDKMIIKTKLHSHLYWHKKSNRWSVCKYCGKSVKLNYIRYHERKHLGIMCAKCPVCLQYSKSPAELEKHMQKHKPGDVVVLAPSVTPRQCEICKKMFKSKNYLKLHINLHFNIKPYACSFCPQRFVSAGFLSMHVKYSHNPVDSGRRCKYCNKSIKSKNTLRDHEASHRNERNHACRLCDKTFIYNTGLEKHVKIHHKNV